MSIYNQTVVNEADRVAQEARRDFFNLSGHGAVTLSAPAGAGKSQFVVGTVAECRARGIRAVVGAPTNEQVFSLVRSIAESDPQTVTYLPGNDANRNRPGWIDNLGNVEVAERAHLASGRAVVVATLDKLASAINPRSSKTTPIIAFDALIIDESYQANSAIYYAVADIAPRHLCVGDSGQILPFTTVAEGEQWRGLAEDPLLTAVDVLHTNHPATRQHRFPITRRLDSRAVPIAKKFYPAEHVFYAAIADGVRSMRLGPTTAVKARDKALDKGLALAAKEGWAYLELPAVQTLVADPETAQLIVDLVARLVGRTALLQCERHPKGIPLAPERIAVVVSHWDQKNMLLTMLDQIGLSGVVVNTANQLQGLEFDVTVCWHPLAGLNEPDKFHLESGRLCVMTTRHRHACIVVGRQGDRDLVQGLSPSTPAFPNAGPDADDILRGWEVHRGIFSALELYLVQVS